VSEVKPPVVDGRDETQVLSDLRDRLPGYIPDWQPRPGTAADALHHVAAGFGVLVGRALDAALSRAQLAFYDACGESRRPPQAAVVPLVWRLRAGTPVDVTLPAGAVVVAQPASTTTEPPTFIATQSIALARARLASVYSVNPLEDRWDDHTPRLTHDFVVFEGADRVEHAIYLGHDHLFKLPPSDARIILHVGLLETRDAVREDLRLEWFYWTESGWWPLYGTVADLLITDGQVDLRKAGGPAAAEREIHGRKSCWIRGVVADPLVSLRGREAGQLPVVDTIRASLDFGREGLRPDAAALDGRPIDTSAPFQPFGPSTVRGTTFALGSSEVFGRPGARVTIELQFAERSGRARRGARAQNLVATTAKGPVTWEYFNGETWLPLPVSDTTNVFAESFATPVPAPRHGIVTFVVPDDWQPTTIGRDTSHFLRVRLDGDAVFGTVPSFPGGTFDPGTMVPPLLDSLRISFSHLTEPMPVDHCVVANGAVFTDVTSAARFPQSTFVPFEPIRDVEPAIYLAFDYPLPQGLVSLFADVPAAEDGDLSDASSPFVWEYLSESSGWRDLGVIDGTEGFRVTGLIQFIGPFDHAASEGPGGTLYRIRARLKQAGRLPVRRIGGLWLNAVMASHATQYEGESLGYGTGQPRQLLLFPQGRTPVLEGERIEVREWAGRDRGYEAIADSVAATDRRTVSDPVTGQIVEVWVRWRERPHLFDAGPGDRVYTLERVGGAVRFGDGQRGFIPPAGAPIEVAFRTGGGQTGNAPAGAVSEPRAAILFLDSVTNPRPARGGSDAEPLDVTGVRGAERLRHRGRALTPRDFEWLAVEASPSVARARCLPGTGPAGAGQRGWVTVVIVPNSRERRPQPDDELLARVRAYLAARAPATVARRIKVVGPRYQAVSVVAEIVPSRPEDAGAVEIEVRRRLDAFLHPLRGGRDGRGWQVGQAVPLSQVAALIEGTDGVDYAHDVTLQVEGARHGDEVPGQPGTLAAPGDHEIRMTLRQEAC
jgi:hypothetical protein